ncbi:MAG: hypothetical protein CVV52_03885 [Spirochaetae bacterium HGW-Spirochaetae-8]|jgi:4-hydroxy-tetrahydrodipicolinate synthase|nr:MAG: hypothetical protein CVV52_03885 [Spirochaetae bacterium HGW-Spirochaetae-8]
MNKVPKGIIPAVITPVDENGDILFSMLEKQVGYLSEAGVDGLFVCGGTGEGAYLSIQEKEEIFKTIKHVVGKRQFLCAACINPSTRGTIQEIKTIQKYQPDYIVAVSPFYIGMSQTDIIDHYRKVAAISDVPVIVYNIPSCTHNPITFNTVKILSDIPNIVAVKDSSGDFCSFSRGLFGQRTSSFTWIQGEDYLCGPSFLAGADGVVSGLSNARVEPYVTMYTAAKAQDWESVKACQKRINDLYEIIQCAGNGIASIKAAAALSDRSTKWMRQASQSLSDGKIKEIADILRRFDEK